MSAVSHGELASEFSVGEATVWRALRSEANQRLVSTDIRNWTLFDIENWTPGLCDVAPRLSRSGLSR
jgi:hypothetical protein